MEIKLIDHPCYLPKNTVYEEYLRITNWNQNAALVLDQLERVSNIRVNALLKGNFDEGEFSGSNLEEMMEDALWNAMTSETWNDFSGSLLTARKAALGIKVLVDLGFIKARRVKRWDKEGAIYWEHEYRLNIKEINDAILKECDFDLFHCMYSWPYCDHPDNLLHICEILKEERERELGQQ